VKLALVRRRWVPDGGGERFTALLAGRLAKAGCSATIVSAEWSGPGDGVAHHRVPVVGRGEFLSLLSFTLSAARHLRRAGYDLVQSHEKLLWQDVYRAGNGCHREWLRQRFRYHPSPRRALVRLAPHHRLVLLLERNLLARRRYRVIVANARRVGEDLVRTYTVPREHVRVIYNGVDLNRFHPSVRAGLREDARRRFEVPADALLVLFMGTGFERKGLGYLLEALPAAGGDVHALVAGRDEQAEHYRALAARLGVAARVRFAGAVAEPERAYAAADVFVLPTIYEPFSNACLEALASGLPVVTTRANGVSELLAGDLGALTLEEPSDREALAGRIARLRDPDLREALGASARAVAETRSIERAVEEFLDLYRALGVG
jgi:UDP-glucose:(heptosyl)LPS alpha-1,3-glucosyltransferase